MTAISKMTDRFSETMIDDEVVIVKLDTGEFFSLSGTAAAAWRLIDGNRGRDALVAALAGQFAADEKNVAEDIDDLLSRLRETGLLAGG